MAMLCGILEPEQPVDNYGEHGKMRKRTKRKVYALVNVIQHAMEGAALVDGKPLEDLRTRELLALEAFRSGTATPNDWRSISAMVNIAEVMAKKGVGPEAIEVCREAELQLLDDHVRFEKTGKMGTTAGGLTAYREVYEYHDLQRTSISRAEYERWIKKTADILKSGQDVVHLT